MVDALRRAHASGIHFGTRAPLVCLRGHQVVSCVLQRDRGAFSVPVRSDPVPYWYGCSLYLNSENISMHETDCPEKPFSALKSHLRPGSMCMAACADIRQGSELPTYHRVLM